MAKFKKLAKLATAKKQDLYNQQVQANLLAKAGLTAPENKPSILQRIGAGLGAFDWTDDALKTMQSGGNLGDFLKSYLIDIPKTVAGAMVGNSDWTDAQEGKGPELMKYLGIESPVARYALGTAADILNPSLLVGGVLGKGVSVTAKGASLLDDVAKLGTKEAVARLGEEFGEEAAKSAAKRLAAKTSITEITKDLINNSDTALGLIKDVKPGAYLGLSAKHSIPLGGGKVGGYAGRLIENPVIGPFQVAGDIAKTAGITEKIGNTVFGKTANATSDMISRNMDLGSELKNTPKVYSAWERGFGVNEASKYVAGKEGQDVADLLSKMDNVSKPEVLDNYVGKLVEGGAGAPESTTINQILKSNVESKVISKETLKTVSKNLDAISKTIGEDIGNMNMTAFNRTISDTGDMFGGNYLKEALGEAYPAIETRMKYAAQQVEDWNKFADNIGYVNKVGTKTVSNADDIARLDSAISNSSMTEEVKNFYKKTLVEQYTRNLDITPVREAVDSNLGNVGMGYFRRSYDMDALKKIDLPEGIKAKLLKNQQRTFPMWADVQTFNEVMSNKRVTNMTSDLLKVATEDPQKAISLVGKKLGNDVMAEVQGRIAKGEQLQTVVKDVVERNARIEILTIDTGAKGLINQISFKAGQDKAVQGLHDMYADIIEQTKSGYLDSGFMLKDKAPSSWIETGVPMMDQAGIRVKPETWKLFKDANEFLVGKKDLSGAFHAMDKINSIWRGMTTAWSIGGVPINPAFFIRNYVNNKFAMVLYGGMNPISIPKRVLQATKVLKILEKGTGGDARIGNYTVKEIGDEFVNRGLIQGTNVNDITQALGQGAWSKIFGKGSTLGNKIELTDKMALFIDQLGKGMSTSEAASKVRFSLFDYAMLTQFEKETLKPAMAFYTWSKKNFQSFFTTWAQDPKRVYVIDKVFRNLKALGEDNNTSVQDLLPDYMKEMYTVAFGDSNTVGSIYGFGTNIEAIGDVLGKTPRETANNVIGMLAPTERIPLEMLTNYSFFRQAPLTDDKSAYTYKNLPAKMKSLLGINESTYTDSKGVTRVSYQMNPYVKYFMSQIRPVSGISKVSNIFTDSGVPGENYLQTLDFLTGVKYKSYDTEYLRKQVESERYKNVMQKLMDAGYVNQYSTYYQTKK